MITAIAGRLESVGESSAVLRPCEAIAIEVLLPAYLVEKMAGRTGQQVSFTTLAYLEGQGQGTSFIPRLIGFERASDRAFFELFTTVKGIGNRRALRAMALRPSEIAALVAAKDAKGLTKLPEIGKRMAETVIAELTGKVERYVEHGIGVEPRLGTPAAAGSARSVGESEAIEVLVQLGEPRAEAESLVERWRSRRSGQKAEGVTADEIVSQVFASRGD
ncbi:MAG: Holliday junction branch migration protein RuvA [Phycisphaerales bacterium]